MQSVFHLRERAMDRSDAHLRVDQLLDLACLDLGILYTPDAGANFGYLQKKMLNFDHGLRAVIIVYEKALRVGKLIRLTQSRRRSKGQIKKNPRSFQISFTILKANL
jgi:hypothetical protein